MRTEVRDRHMCAGCGRRFTVVYHHVDPDEPTRLVPVHCPRCGSVNRVEVASPAALAPDYWTETAR